MPIDVTPRTPCKFHLQGRCARGDACTWLHPVGGDAVDVDLLQLLRKRGPDVLEIFRKYPELTRIGKAVHYHSFDAVVSPFSTRVVRNMSKPSKPPYYVIDYCVFEEDVEPIYSAPDLETVLGFIPLKQCDKCGGMQHITGGWPYTAGKPFTPFVSDGAFFSNASWACADCCARCSSQSTR